MANVRSVRRDPPRLRWQPTLLGAGDAAPSCAATFAGARRVALGGAAWVEHVPGWVRGDHALFEEVLTHAPWEQRTVRMYERVVDEPRLTAWYGTTIDDPGLPPFVGAAAAALGARYGRVFDGVGAALYRDGNDSVAWHGDRVDPTLVEPVVAIVSLGSARVLHLRPRARRGRSHAYRLLPGDLFVMGGTTQVDWEHAVPKVARAGARVSLQFRHST
jgi:alkylated DNA repair dioxygenase AlkB